VRRFKRGLANYVEFVSLCSLCMYRMSGADIATVVREAITGPMRRTMNATHFRIKAGQVRICRPFSYTRHAVLKPPRTFPLHAMQYEPVLTNPPCQACSSRDEASAATVAAVAPPCGSCGAERMHLNDPRLQGTLRVPVVTMVRYGPLECSAAESASSHYTLNCSSTFFKPSCDRRKRPPRRTLHAVKISPRSLDRRVLQPP
jgi:SpoVK/Ycf46/Vps4 family AAA+-type ATPase